jgi:cytochrome P450
VPAGTQLVIVNVYGHRDRDRLEFADRFAPEEWIEGGAGAYPAFNHFSRGPQGCPGAALALLVGRTALRALLEQGVADPSPRLDLTRPLPHMLDYFAVSISS